MEQHKLRSPRGARQARKRLGRGNASGQGTYAGKGMKGQQSRSGYKTRPAFEGGQTALVRRLPRRRGFTNPFRLSYSPVNLKALAGLPEGTEVTPELLRERGIVRTLRQPIKILALGDISASLTVRAHRVSAGARAKIEAAGGTVEELTPRPEKTDEPKRPKRSRAKAAPATEAATQEDEQPTPSADEEEQDDGDSETSEA